MNSIQLIGNFTRDPDTNEMASGGIYTKFTLAVQRIKREEVDFINCVAFGKVAELIADNLRKGQKLGVNGSLRMNRWEKDGENRTSYDVLVNSITFVGSKGSREEEEPSNDTSNYSQMPTTDDDEFPF